MLENCLWNTFNVWQYWGQGEVKAFPLLQMNNEKLHMNNVCNYTHTTYIDSDRKHKISESENRPLLLTEHLSSANSSYPNSPKRDTVKATCTCKCRRICTTGEEVHNDDMQNFCRMTGI